MNNMIDNINLNKLFNIGASNKCSCNGESSSSNKGFEIAYNSLISALSKKEREIAVSSANLLLNKENNKENNELENNTLFESLISNKVETTNRVEITNKDENTSKRIENAVKKASKQYGVDENLIKAIIKVESNFNPNTVSSAGAKGLMQLMPENCKDLGVKNPFNIEENIDAGTRHIKEYLDMFDGNIEMGLMAYNGGPGRMRRRGVKVPSDIYKMPKETQNYVPKVMKLYRGK